MLRSPALTSWLVCPSFCHRHNSPTGRAAHTFLEGVPLAGAKSPHEKSVRVRREPTRRCNYFRWNRLQSHVLCVHGRLIEGCAHRSWKDYARKTGFEHSCALSGA